MADLQARRLSDLNPARRANVRVGVNAGTEPGEPQTDAERARDLENILQRVREVVGTDMVLVSCEEHEVRIAELTTALRDVLAQFVHHGHPGEPCKQTGWVSVRTVQRWQAVLDGEGP